jgi:hypothetical protein
MANGVGNLLSLQGKVDASNRLVLTVGTIQTASGTASTGATGPLARLQGKVTANNELVVRFA